MNGINTPYGLKSSSSSVGSGTATLLHPYPVHVDPVTHRTGNFNFFNGDPVFFNANVDSTGIRPGGFNARQIGTPDDAYPILGVFAQASTSPTNPYPGLQAPVQGMIPAGYYSDTPVFGWVMDDYTSTFIVQVSTSSDDYRDAIFKWNWIGANAFLRVGGVEIDNHIPEEYGVVKQNPVTGNLLQGSSVYYLDGSSVNAAEDQATNRNIHKQVRIRGVAPVISTNQVGADDAAQAQQNYISTLKVGVDMPFISLIVQFSNAQFNPGAVSLRSDQA